MFDSRLTRILPRKSFRLNVYSATLDTGNNNKDVCYADKASSIVIKLVVLKVSTNREIKISQRANSCARLYFGKRWRCLCLSHFRHVHDYFRAMLPYQTAIAILSDKEDFHAIQNKVKKYYKQRISYRLKIKRFAGAKKIVWQIILHIKIN